METIQEKIKRLKILDIKAISNQIFESEEAIREWTIFDCSFVKWFKKIIEDGKFLVDKFENYKFNGISDDGVGWQFSKVLRNGIEFYLLFSYDDEYQELHRVDMRIAVDFDTLLSDDEKIWNKWLLKKNSLVLQSWQKKAELLNKLIKENE